MSLNKNLFDFRRDHLFGRFRVLINHNSMTKVNSPFYRIKIRFHGRGEGHGSYRINNATVSWRSEKSLNVLPSEKVSVLTVNGQTSFDVIEQGVITDEADIRYALFYFKFKPLIALIVFYSSKPTNEFFKQAIVS